MPARSFFLILVALTAVADTAAGQQTHQAACPAMDMIRASADGQGEASVEDLVRQLRKLGLLITADQKKIEAATSEAAYFMFAGRKEHRPRCEPFMLPKKGRWLEGKPVFATKAEKESIDPLFDRLVKMMGYSEVCVYAADVYYGVSNHAVFRLYKLGYLEDDQRRGKKLEVLLGDVDYVINLP